MDNLLSVIVPVYNVEKYLRKCLDSILNQTYTNFELILVNDGSKDNSGNICDEYALIDNRIKVIHKENGGLPSARNAGLEIISGDFVTFVDSDDWIEYNTFEIIINAQKENDIDLIIYGCNLVYKNKIKQTKNKYNLCFTQNEFYNNFFYVKENCHFNFVWNKLYKTSVLNKNLLVFSDYYKIEDFLFNIDYISAISSVKIITNKLYNYNKLVDTSITATYKKGNCDFDIMVINNIKDFLDIDKRSHHYKIFQIYKLGNFVSVMTECYKSALSKEDKEEEYKRIIELYYPNGWDNAIGLSFIFSNMYRDAIKNANAKRINRLRKFHLEFFVYPSYKLKIKNSIRRYI